MADRSKVTAAHELGCIAAAIPPRPFLASDTATYTLRAMARKYEAEGHEDAADHLRRAAEAVEQVRSDRSH